MNIARKLSFNNSFEILKKYHLGTSLFQFESCMNVGKVFTKSPGVGGYSHTLPIWVCAAQRGRDFEAPALKWGIHFRGVF